MDVYKLTPLQAIIIFSLFMGMLIFWHWADSRALDYMGPVHMHTDRDGSLFIQIDNHLIEHDASGKFVADHNLKALGIEKFLGDFAFFNNGDILLAKRETLPGLDENLSAYKRETNQRPVESGNTGDGLFRCSLQHLSCEHFGHKTLDFGRAFHLYISPEDESVYVADSSRHSLRKYSNDGTELASRDSSFIFPNQILIHDGKLYVTNTNNHSIQVVRPDTKKFAQSIEMFDIRNSDNKTISTKSPSSLLRVGAHWWVNNMNSGMAFGSIDFYDEEWKYSKSLKLPDGADPQAMILYNGNVLISDFSLYHVYQFDTEGNALEDFQSPQLNRILNDQTEQHRYYRSLQKITQILFIAVIILGIFFIWRLLSRLPDIDQPPDAEEKSVDIHATEIKWVSPAQEFLRRERNLWILISLFTICFIGALAIAMVLTPGFEYFWFMITGVTVFLFFLYNSKSEKNTRIGIYKDMLILEDHRGQHATGRGPRIHYSDSHLFIDNISVTLSEGNRNKIFSTRDLVENVYPMMTGATYVDKQRTLVMLFRRKHFSIMAPLLIGCIIFIFVAWEMIF